MLLLLLRPHLNLSKVSKHKSFTLKELAQITDSVVVGDENIFVDNISSIDNATNSSITFLSNNKYASKLKSSIACAVIVKKDFKTDKSFNYLKTGDPYLCLLYTSPSPRD